MRHEHEDAQAALQDRLESEQQKELQALRQTIVALSKACGMLPTDVSTNAKMKVNAKFLVVILGGL